MIVVCERMTNSCLFTCCLGRRLFGVATSCNFDLEVSLDKTRTPCTHCRLVVTWILSQYVASFIFCLCLFIMNWNLVCKNISSFLPSILVLCYTSFDIRCAQMTSQIVIFSLPQADSHCKCLLPGRAEQNISSALLARYQLGEILARQILARQDIRTARYLL